MGKMKGEEDMKNAGKSMKSVKRKGMRSLLAWCESTDREERDKEEKGKHMSPAWCKESILIKQHFLSKNPFASQKPLQNFCKKFYQKRFAERTCAKKENMPLAKQFGQAFLKLDTWCESTRGQKKWKESRS